MKKILLYLTFIISANNAIAKDTVELANGDVLTGTVLQQTAHHIYFKSPIFGTVSLSTRDVLNVTLDAKEISKNIPTAEPISQKLPQPQAQPPMAPSKEKNQWSGQAGMAIAMRESNTFRRTSSDTFSDKTETFESYRLYGHLKWNGKRNNLKWNWTYRYSRSDLRKNDDYLNLTQNYQHKFTPKYFTSAKTVFQKDYRRGINNEFLQTAEIGIQWVDQPKLKFSTSIGGGYHQYDRMGNSYSEGNGRFTLDESIRWQMINSLTLFQKYTHLGGLKQFHFVFTSGLENKLIRDVFIRMEYRLDRDTDVDYDDRGYYDKALLTSILYKF